MKWKTLEQSYIYKSKWITLRKDAVELPTGIVIPDFYVLEYPTWINVIAITTDGKFILERQFRYGISETYYELPAGVCEKRESPLETAKRELLEETGYSGGQWQEWMKSAPNTNTMTNYSYTFLATGVEKHTKQHLEETEVLEVQLLEKQQVYDMLLSVQIVEADMVAPLWKYFANDKTK